MMQRERKKTLEKSSMPENDDWVDELELSI
jgi:hypothetical protein